MSINISVVIPIYNAEKYLSKCLDSVCVQDSCVKEIILVNDGSGDGSLKICNEYAERDKRIKIINQENKGAAAAIIEGVRTATCDYVGFVDSDDYIEPNMFSTLATVIEKAGADIAWCEYDSVDETGTVISTPPPNDGIVTVYEKQNGKFSVCIYPMPCTGGYFMTGSRCNKLIKRDLIINNIAFEDFGIKIGEDTALTVPVMFTANKMVHINKALYHYVQHPSSAVHSYSGVYLDDYYKIVDIIDRARKEYNYDMPDFALFKSLQFYNATLSKACVLNLTCQERKKAFKEICSLDEFKTLCKVTKVKCNYKLKMLLWLLKHKLYSLAAFIVNRVVKK